MPVLKNVECKWACIQEPNTKFEPTWEIEALLSSQQAAELAALGFKLKEDDKGTPTYRFKRKVGGKKKGGGEFKREQPKVVDASKKPFEGLIGNGSVVNIQYKVMNTEFMGQAFVKGDLCAVQVLKLVSYGGDDGDEFDDEGPTETIAPMATADGDEFNEDDCPF